MKAEHDGHVASICKVFDAYPSHLAYPRKWFNNPQSIARYSVQLICGGLCSIIRSTVEQVHSSDK